VSATNKTTTADLALAVVRHHVDSPNESDRVNIVAAVNGVFALILVSLDHIVAGTGAHRVDATVVSAYQVRTLTTEHGVIAGVTPYLIRAPIAGHRVVTGVALNSLATIEGPTGTAGHRVVACVPANAVYSAFTREGVVPAAASYVLGAGCANQGIGPGGAFQGRCPGHPTCQ
jgi:hypothetical protein